jgi:3-methyladenine DNA glycosylase Tag
MRCSWCNPTNPKYLNSHDHEWGVPNSDDAYLYEMLILESFQAGLSWECVTNKREAFKKAYDNFDSQKVSTYDAAKITELLNNKQIQQLINSIETIKTIMKDCDNDTAYHFELDNQIVSIANDRFSLLDFDTNERLMFVKTEPTMED